MVAGTYRYNLHSTHLSLPNICHDLKLSIGEGGNYDVFGLFIHLPIPDFDRFLLQVRGGLTTDQYADINIATTGIFVIKVTGCLPMCVCLFQTSSLAAEPILFFFTM